MVAVLKRRKAVERALEIAKAKTVGTERVAAAAEVEADSGETAAVAEPDVADDVAETAEPAETTSK